MSAAPTARATTRWFFEWDVWDGMGTGSLRRSEHSVLTPARAGQNEAIFAFRLHYAISSNPWTRFRLTGRAAKGGKRMRIDGKWIVRPAEPIEQEV